MTLYEQLHDITLCDSWSPEGHLYLEDDMFELMVSGWLKVT